MKMYKNYLIKSTFLSCVVIALGLASPAYGENEEDIGCTTEEKANGCVLTYDEIKPAVTAKDAVPGIYNVEIGGVTYGSVTGTITFGSMSILTLATPDAGDPDGNMDSRTVTFDNSMAGAQASITVVKAPVAARTATAEMRIPKGADSTALGKAAITKGLKSVAVGEGATIGRVKPAVTAKDAVPGIYNVEIGGVTYGSVTGTITFGSMSILTLATPDAGDPDGNMDSRTVTFDSSMAGAQASITVVKAPVAARTATAEMRLKADNAVAIGADSSVTGDNGIAIGAGVTAGENQIVIGKDGQSAVIGGVDLAGIETNVADIATNRAGIETNVADIATNRAGIETNTGSITALKARIATEVTASTEADTALGARIDTNVADIATNRAGIATNRAGIATNRSGVAMAIAFAHLPSVVAGDRGSWGIAAGSFDGESALAAGITLNVQEKSQVKLGVSSSGGETSFGIGFGKGF